MKALTICQPYAHLIVCGQKLVENREWPTRYRGPLVIHAGKSREWLGQEDEQRFERNGNPLAFGAAVGVAQVVDCLHIDGVLRGDHDEKYPWLALHEHTHGPWCWVLANARRIAPVPWRGAQRLWEFPDAALPPEAK